jgi:integral membrane sensor domain MASE1
MAMPRSLTKWEFLHRGPVVVAVYLIGYVLLDWASYLYPFAAPGISPWNPSAGLSFALILLADWRYLPLLAVAPLLANIVVRRSPLSGIVEVSIGLANLATYGMALWVLSSRRVKFDAALATIRDLLLLLAAGFLGPFLAAGAVVCILVGAGQLSVDDAATAFVRLWVADAIGIVIMAPFLLLFGTGRIRSVLGTEQLLQVVAIFVTVILFFSAQGSSHLQLFYLLFLPIIWIALRSGLQGVTIGLVITQILLVIGMQFTKEDANTVTAYQIRVFVLAMTGLVMGAVVSRQRQTELRLRLQQEALAKATRVASMGEFAAAVAHELNQPLGAIATYTQLVKRQLEQASTDKSAAIEASSKPLSKCTGLQR